MDASKLEELPSSQSTLLKDLCGAHQASTNYEDFLESTCDDLLETVDKKIDLVSKRSTTKQESVVKRDMRSNEQRFDKYLEKPQNKFISDVDNSY